jgi:hypothetical protein
LKGLVRHWLREEQVVYTVLGIRPVVLPSYLCFLPFAFTEWGTRKKGAKRHLGKDNVDLLVNNFFPS